MRETFNDTFKFQHKGLEMDPFMPGWSRSGLARSRGWSFGLPCGKVEITRGERTIEELQLVNRPVEYIGISLSKGSKGNNGDDEEYCGGPTSITGPSHSGLPPDIYVHNLPQHPRRWRKQGATYNFWIKL